MLEQIEDLRKSELCDPIGGLRLSKPVFDTSDDDYLAVLACTLKIFVENGAHPNVLCTHIKNFGGPKEKPRYLVHFSTPGQIFSPDGLCPGPELARALKSRGAIEFLETIPLQSTGWDDAETEAIKLKSAVTQRLQKTLRLQKLKTNMGKRSNNWRSSWKRPYQGGRKRL